METTTTTTTTTSPTTCIYTFDESIDTSNSSAVVSKSFSLPNVTSIESFNLSIASLYGEDLNISVTPPDGAPYLLLNEESEIGNASLGMQVGNASLVKVAEYVFVKAGGLANFTPSNGLLPPGTYDAVTWQTAHDPGEWTFTIDQLTNVGNAVSLGAVAISYVPESGFCPTSVLKSSNQCKGGYVGTTCDTRTGKIDTGKNFMTCFETCYDRGAQHFWFDGTATKGCECYYPCDLLGTDYSEENHTFYSVGDYECPFFECYEYATCISGDSPSTLQNNTEDCEAFCTTEDSADTTYDYDSHDGCTCLQETRDDCAAFCTTKDSAFATYVYETYSCTCWTSCNATGSSSSLANNEAVFLAKNLSDCEAITQPAGASSGDVVSLCEQEEDFDEGGLEVSSYIDLVYYAQEADCNSSICRVGIETSKTIDCEGKNIEVGPNRCIVFKKSGKILNCDFILKNNSAMLIRTLVFDGSSITAENNQISIGLKSQKLEFRLCPIGWSSSEASDQCF